MSASGSLQQLRQQLAHALAQGAQRVQGAGAQAGLIGPQQTQQLGAALPASIASQAGEHCLPYVGIAFEAQCRGQGRRSSGDRRGGPRGSPALVRVGAAQSGQDCSAVALRALAAAVGFTDRVAWSGTRRLQATRDLWQWHNPAGAACAYQLARHPPHDGGFFRLGDGAAALGPQRGHGLRAIIAHARHQDPDELRGRQRAPWRSAPDDRYWDARDSPARAGTDMTSSAAGALRDHNIGITSPDVDQPGCRISGLRDFHDREGAQIHPDALPAAR